ncbi:MAG: acetylornithine/succinylornithine family transaminase [Clostridia bacterium]|nr:acetylornithine/succinylornithine family transaminase [Clostridia bacterium]
MNVKALDREYIMGTYSRFPLTLTKGKGSKVYDEEGKEYIDLGSGIAVNIFGIADDEWVNAVTAQLGSLQHTSNLYYSEPCAKLAKVLCERTGMSKVFFSNSGAEANECAIKAARKYAAENLPELNPVMLTLVNSFHGRTIATISATGQDVFHKDFKPLVDGFEHTPANDIEALEKTVKELKPFAIMFECVQGEGGVLPLEKPFVDKILELQKEYGFLVICDEVQTGNGRTGELYAFMNYGFTPDIFTTAKGLGAGLPIGATVFSEKVSESMKSGDHGSTFGGNPVACAGALNVIERIDDKLLEDVRVKSEYIISEFKNAKGVKSIAGMGLMLGIETERDASEIIADCMQDGVLVIKAKNKVRLLPALNIPMEDLKKAVEIIKTNIAKGV